MGFPYTFPIVFGPPVIGQITNHVQAAINRLAEQYKKPNIQGFLTAFATEIQDVENMLWGLYTGRWLSTAQGASLDQLGKIVGQPRNGQDDVTYLIYIGSRIALNKESCTVEDLYRIFIGLLPGATLSIVNYLICNFVFYIFNFPLTNVQGQTLLQLFRQARAAGVGGQMRWSPVVESQTFSFAGGPGLGFDDLNAPGGGGHFVSVYG